MQWHIEDSRAPPDNMRLVGDRNEQQSKYVLFEVQQNEDEQIIKVILRPRCLSGLRWPRHQQAAALAHDAWPRCSEPLYWRL